MPDAITDNNTSDTQKRCQEIKQPAGLNLFIRLDFTIIAIIVCSFGVLVLFSLPHVREARPDLYELSKLKQLGAAAYTYANENDESLPPYPNYLIAFVSDSVSQRDLFLSPYRKKQTGLVQRSINDDQAARYGDFVFLSLGENLEEIQAPGTSILAYSAKISDKQTMRSILFADGHVERLNEKIFRESLPPEVDVDVLDGP